MIPTEITRWLEEHGKGDLFECTWEEIKEAMTAANMNCPIAEYAIERQRQERDR